MNSGGGYVPYPRTDRPVVYITDVVNPTPLPSGYNWLVTSATTDGSLGYPKIVGVTDGHLSSYEVVLSTVYSDSIGCYSLSSTSQKKYFIVTGGHSIRCTGSGGSERESNTAILIRL